MMPMMLSPGDGSGELLVLSWLQLSFGASWRCEFGLIGLIAALSAPSWQVAAVPMKALKQTLQRHSVTRQWVGLDPDALPEDEKDLRKEVEWQQAVTDALLSYGQGVETALYSMLQAHQALVDLGLESLCPESASILQALRKLLSRTRQGIESAKSPLQVHDSALATCSESVKKVDEARSVRKHYQDKVQQLEEELTRKPAPSTQARLERNREKLLHATKAADTDTERTRELLRGCASRRLKLQEVTRTIMSSVSDALRSAALVTSPSPPTALTVPIPGYSSSAPSVSVSAPPSGSGSPNRFNPFTEDLQKNPFADLDDRSPGPEGPASSEDETRALAKVSPQCEQTEHDAAEHAEAGKVKLECWMP